MTKIYKRSPIPYILDKNLVVIIGCIQSEVYLTFIVQYVKIPIHILV